MGMVCVDIGSMAPFFGCIEEHKGVDRARDETAEEKHEKHVSERPG
jgi:hypothetical protein